MLGEFGQCLSGTRRRRMHVVVLLQIDHAFQCEHRESFRQDSYWQRRCRSSDASLQNAYNCARLLTGHPNNLLMLSRMNLRTASVLLVVEAGTFRGGSAIIWAMMFEHINPGGAVITIDINDRREERAK
jgi:cephalosporin hydroxylase